MARLFVTGDIHQGIDIGKLNSRRFPVGNDLTKEDIVVILGDAGLVWDGGGSDKHWQKWLAEKPWTTICVLGNHENYDMIEQMPVTEFNGVPARQVYGSVWYAMTGEVYNLCGKKCLFMNGAESHDQEFRTEGVSWWRQESITQDDVSHALITLALHNDCVDYLFSHTGGVEVVNNLGFKIMPSDRWLDVVINTIDPKCGFQHYCGHYHVDRTINENTKVLYNDIILLHDTECDIDDGACVSLFDGLRIDGEEVN